MRTELRIAVWASCAVMSAGWVLAQEETAKPVSVDRPVKLSISLRGDYTDNRDSEESSVAEDTFDFYVKPRVDLFLHPELMSINAFYAPSWRYRTDPSVSQNEDEFWHDAGVGMDWSVSPSASVFAREKFDYTDDPAVDNNGNEVRGDRSYYLNRVEVGTLCDVSETWSSGLTGRYKDKSYDKSSVADNNDETRADAEATATKHLSRSLSAYGMASFSDFGYEDSIGIKRDFQSTVLAVGAETVINPQLRAGGAIGWQASDYDDASLGKKDIPYARLWVTGQTTPAMRLTAEAVHSMRDSDVYPFSSQEFTSVSAGAEYDCSARWVAGLDASYRLSDYDDLDSAPDSAFETGRRSGSEDRYTAEGSVAYKVGPLSRVTLSQCYEERASEVANDFTKNTTRLVYGRQF